MSFVEINIRSNIERFRKSLETFERDQLPFATKEAINNLAKIVQKQETEALPRVFDRPTPFTMRAYGVTSATKSKPEAIVFVKDIQAAYLRPYEFGGKQVPHGVAMLTPKGIKLNQYGNIPRNTIKTLLASDLGNAKAVRGMSSAKKKRLLANQQKYFVGSIKTSGGQRISGIWQRPESRAGGGHLKLLVRFTDPQQVKQHLDFRKRAKDIVIKNFDLQMRLAMKYALETRK